MELFSGIIITALIVLVLIFGLYVLLYRKKRLSDKEIKQILILWQEIEAIAAQHPEQAIIKADKLLDHALKKAGFQGTLGEKMNKAQAVFRDNNGIWSAHKLRNRIAHEINVNISASQAQLCLKNFKNALFDLGIRL